MRVSRNNLEPESYTSGAGGSDAGCSRGTLKPTCGNSTLSHPPRKDWNPSAFAHDQAWTISYICGA